MGSHLVNYQVRAESAEPVRAMARRVCVGPAYVVPARNGWVAVYEEASDGQKEALLHQIAQDLSVGLATAVFAFQVEASDVLRYLLYERGELAAEYDSWPDYHDHRVELEEEDPQEATPRPHPDQLLLFDIGEPVAAPGPGSPEAVLRYCKPGTTLAEVRDLLRQDRWSRVSDPAEENRWAPLRGDARLDELARLLGIDEHLARLSFKYLEEELDMDGLQALPGVRKVRGKATVRAPRNVERPRSLAWAVAEGDVAAIRRFLAAGADPNAKVPKRDSLLEIAAQRGHFEVALALLEAGARPSSGDSVTLLMRAVSFGRPEVVPELVAAGVDVAAMDYFALFCAVCARSSDRPSRAEVEALEALIRAGADVHARDAQGKTPLTLAAEVGHREFIKVLLQAGADIDATGRHGQTALMCAVLREARSRCRHIVRLLLDAGANPNIRDDQGWTALLYAVVQPMADRRAARLVADLIRAGADVNARTEDGETLESVALFHRLDAAARLLRNAGANS